MEKYSLVKVIGEGSFGRAVLVRCKSSQEKYVVKEIQLPKVCARKGGNVLTCLEQTDQSDSNLPPKLWWL